jgi:hypothetical protein
LQEDPLLSDESTNTLLADFPSHPLPALSVSDDNLDDTHVPVTTDDTISVSNETFSVPTFQYPAVDLDPISDTPHDNPPMTSESTTPTLLQRPSLTRRATSSFIRASTRASTVAAFPLVHAVLFVFSLLAVTSTGGPDTTSTMEEDQAVAGVVIEPDAGLGDALRSGDRSRRRYLDRRRGQRGRMANEQEHETAYHQETSEQAGEENGEGVDREAVLPGGWIDEGSSR